MALAVSVICVAALIASAAITSGAYTSDHSTQVTYTEVDIARPSVSVGDLMLASIAVLNGSAAVLNSEPSGWTLIASTSNDTNVSLRSYYRIATAADTSTSTYLWRFLGQTTAEGAIIPYAGASTTNPIDASSENIGFGTLATTTTITTGGTNEKVVALFAIDVGKSSEAGNYFSTSTTPYGMTKKYDLAHTPFGPSIAAMEVTQAAAGSTGSASTTISGNKARNWAAHMIALRPIVFPDPVAYWKLDETSGNASDATGNGNTLTNNNSIAYITNGKINNGADLEVASTTYFSITDGSQTGLDITGDITLAGWVKLESTPPDGGSAGVYVIAAKDGDGQGPDVDISQRGYDFMYRQTGGVLKLTFNVSADCGVGAFRIAIT